jgi:hypothetical protein
VEEQQIALEMIISRLESTSAKRSKITDALERISQRDQTINQCLVRSGTSYPSMAFRKLVGKFTI